MWEIGHAFTKRERHPNLIGFVQFSFCSSQRAGTRLSRHSLAEFRCKFELESGFHRSALCLDDDTGGESGLVVTIGGNRDEPSLTVSRWIKQKQRGSRLRSDLSDQPNRAVHDRRQRAAGGRYLAPHTRKEAQPTLLPGCKAMTYSSGATRVLHFQRRRTTTYNCSSRLPRETILCLQLGAVVALRKCPIALRRRAPPTLFDKVRSLRSSHPDKTMRESAFMALREPAYCYQEIDTRKPPDQRYFSACHASADLCERLRGTSRPPSWPSVALPAEVTQSACAAIDLKQANSEYFTQADRLYFHRGIGGAWYQFSPSVVGPPFPPVAQR